MEEDDKPEIDLSQFEGMTIGQLLEEGRKALLIQLVAAVRSNSASHQEKAVLRNLLKDNGLVLGMEQTDADRKTPQDLPVPVDLPDFEEPEYLN